MRVRSVHVRGHEKVGTLDVDLRGEDGEIPHRFAIIGWNGRGKSLLLNLIRCAWLGSVTGQDFRGAFGKCEAQVNFEQGGEIFPVRYNGALIGSKALGMTADMEQRRNLLLWYGPERLWGASGESLGVRSVQRLLEDIQRLPAPSGCVALIDDYDLGLDAVAREKLFGILATYHSRCGNQMIVTSRGEVDCRKHHLYEERGTEWLDELVVALNGKKGP